MTSPEPVWYRRGLRFACTGCGRCCRNLGREAYVYVSPPESRALARHLGLGHREFLAAYTRRVAGWVVLRDRGEGCILLDEHNRCRAYPARPRQCRTWPFWPENVASPAAWREVRRICPGAGRGRAYAPGVIQAIARYAAGDDGRDGPTVPGCLTDPPSGPGA